jgi:hypothetical protein
MSKDKMTITREIMTRKRWKKRTLRMIDTMDKEKIWQRPCSIPWQNLVVKQRLPRVSLSNLLLRREDMALMHPLEIELRAKTLFLVSLLATLTPEVSKKPLSKCT